LAIGRSSTSGETRAYDAQGNLRWTFNGGGVHRFESAVTSTASGLLLAVAAASGASLQSTLYAFTKTGQPKWERPLRGGFVYELMVDNNEHVIVRSSTGLTVFDRAGTITFDKTMRNAVTNVQIAASSPPRVWFPPDFSVAEVFDVEAGNTAPFAVGGIASGFVATRDGSLVYVDITPDGTNVRGLDADGIRVQWSVPVEARTGQALGPSLGADGTVYVPYGDALYVIGR
jgi:outer membrane protein assembly factor BamB